MGDINTLSITGNLGRDAEQRQTGGGKTMLSFSVANTTGYGDNEKTNWFNCAIFGKQAEGKLVDYLKKGQQVTVQGECTLNEYTNNDGVKVGSLSLFVRDIKLQGGKREQNQGGQQQNQGQQQSAPQGQNNNGSPPAGGGSNFDDFDDDIPF